MKPRYIELDELTHLNQQKNLSTNGVYKSKLWRESYYFNFTDQNSGITLITTIGILPNKKLLTGLVLVIQNDRVIKLNPLLQLKAAVFNEYTFIIKGLEYRVSGPFWYLKYNSDKLKFDISFEPINKIFPYVTKKSDGILNSIGSQHYEQFGIYKGEFANGAEKVLIGPCLGHRDHSWGIRDWGGVEKYKLFCCAFSKCFAFNLWEGWIANHRFVKGYVFDGDKNNRIVESNVSSNYHKNSKRPTQAEITLLDELGKKYNISTQVKVTIPVPPKQSILHECIAKMRSGKFTGFGLQEYLFHEPRKMIRLWTLLKALRYL